MPSERYLDVYDNDQWDAIIADNETLYEREVWNPKSDQKGTQFSEKSANDGHTDENSMPSSNSHEEMLSSDEESSEFCEILSPSVCTGSNISITWDVCDQEPLHEGGIPRFSNSEDKMVWNSNEANESKKEVTLNEKKSSFECSIDFFENLNSKNSAEIDVKHKMERKRSSFACIVMDFENKIKDNSSKSKTRESSELFFDALDDSGFADDSTLCLRQDVSENTRSIGIEIRHELPNDGQRSAQNSEYDIVCTDDNADVSILVKDMVKEVIMTSERSLLLEYWRIVNKSTSSVSHTVDNKEKTNGYEFKKFFDYDINLSPRSKTSVINKPTPTPSKYHTNMYNDRRLAAKPIKVKSLGRGRGKPYDVISHSSNRGSHVRVLSDPRGARCRGHGDRIIPKELDKLANMLSKYAVIGAQRDMSTEYLDLEYAKLRRIRLASRRSTCQPHRRMRNECSFDKNNWPRGVIKDHSVASVPKHVSFSNTLPVNDTSTRNISRRREKDVFVCQACSMNNAFYNNKSNTRSNEFEFQQQTIKCSLCNKKH